MAIIDSTCLIYLAKTGKLNLLKQIYKKVFIPKAVYKEIILKGKEKGKEKGGKDRFIYYFIYFLL